VTTLSTGLASRARFAFLLASFRMRAPQCGKAVVMGACVLSLLGAISAPARAQSITFAGVQITVPSSGLNHPSGVAVDGAGDVFIADEPNSRVVRVTPSGAQSTVPASGLNFPYGVAVGGTGDVFIADTYNNRVVRVTPSGAQGTVPASGLNHPYGVAVDGAGDVFIADSENNRAVKVTPSGVQTTVPASGLSLPSAVAVDGAGDVFIADTGNLRVVEVTPGGVQTTVPASGLVYPFGVAVDGAGDVFIADTFNDRVVEVPACCGAQFTVGSGLYVPRGVAVDGAGDVFIADTYNNRVEEEQLDSVNFGYVHVCPGGQTNLAPCNQTLTLNYNVVADITLGATNVFTQGTPNLDFTLGSGGTCTGSLTADSTCTVNVTLAPRAPGERLGAVQLTATPNIPLITTMVHGIGRAPAIAFGPGTQTTVGSGLNTPVTVAVDAAGDVFIAADFGGFMGFYGQVVEVPAGCTSAVCQITVGSGLYKPLGLAVDGAGDLFIANGATQVVKVPPGCTITACETMVGSGLTAPFGVAVDGAGDLFISDEIGNFVYKVTPTGTQTTVNTGPFILNNPLGVAVDAAGDLFIADAGNQRVVKVPASGVPTKVWGDTGVSAPYGVAVDAAGDLFIADAGNQRVVEVLAGGGETLVANGTGTFGVAVDGAGDIFIADDGLSGPGQVVEVQRSLPPTLTFAATAVGEERGPQSVTIQNIGNQPLDAVTPGLAVTGPNFLQVAGSGKPADCTSGFALTLGATCNLSISFEPQSAGSLTSAATFTDNALNATPSATQSITLQGTGKPLAQAVSFTGAPAGAVDGSNFTVVATSNSNITPTITAVGACTVGATFASGASFDAIVTMTKSTGGCTTRADWPENGVYKAASATQTTTAE
jgi:sugar lactone lactonase YvrE